MTMGWGDSENRGSSAVWMIIAFAIAVALFSGGRGWGWGWWMLFPLFFFVIPMIRRYATCDSPAGKRKNEYEKPKRYVTREDGERLEVIDEAPQGKRKTDAAEIV